MTRQARILAFGDSLTWGRIANRPERHGDDVRWPRVLEKALGGYATVIEEGLNGRRIALDDPLRPYRSGISLLPLRTREPRSLKEINDRRNELSGNLSLGQELFFVQRINRLLQQYPVLGDRYKTIRIRVVELAGEEFDYPSKLDRSRYLIEELIERGGKSAEAFFESSSEWEHVCSMPMSSVRAAAAE